MKLNISYPATGCQKLIDIDDERKLRVFYDKRLAAEVSAESLGDEWKGYVVRISGGNDKQGFPMKQGVMTNGRVKLLLSDGHSCYRIRRSGERRRKSVRGCIVDANLSVLSLVIIKKGEQEIPGLTDKTIPRRLGPKRAMKIRKLFNLDKKDDVRQYVVRRPLPVKEGKKPHTKAPKIQRLVTSLVLQRKRHRLAIKRRRSIKKREDLAEYQKLLAQRLKEAKEKKMERRRSASQSKSSVSRTESTTVTVPKSDSQKAVKPVKVVKPPSVEVKSAASKKTDAKKATVVKSAPTPAPAKTATTVKVPTKQASAPTQAKAPAAGKPKPDDKGAKPKGGDKGKGKQRKK